MAEKLNLMDFWEKQSKKPKVVLARKFLDAYELETMFKDPIVTNRFSEGVALEPDDNANPAFYLAYKLSDLDRDYDYDNPSQFILVRCRRTSDSIESVYDTGIDEYETDSSFQLEFDDQIYTQSGHQLDLNEMESLALEVSECHVVQDSSNILVDHIRRLNGD